MGPEVIHIPLPDVRGTGIQDKDSRGLREEVDQRPKEGFLPFGPYDSPFGELSPYGQAVNCIQNPFELKVLEKAVQ